MKLTFKLYFVPKTYPRLWQGLCHSSFIINGCFGLTNFVVDLRIYTPLQSNLLVYLCRLVSRQIGAALKGGWFFLWETSTLVP